MAPVLDSYRVIELGMWVAGPGARAACWPTGAPTSSRSRRRSATRCGGCSSCSPATASPSRRRSTSTTGASAASSSTWPCPRAREIVRRLLARRRRVPHQPPPRGGRAPRPRARRAAGRVPAARLRSRSAATGSRGPRSGRAGYDVGAFWARSGIAVAHGARRHRPARRPLGHGRPRHRHHHGGRHPRRAARSRAHRAGASWSRRRCCAPGIYSVGLGPRHPDAVRQDRLGPAPHHRDEPDVQLLPRPATGAGSGCSASRPTACGRSCARPSIVRTCSTDERFSTARGRRHDASELVELLDEVFARSTRDELTERFDRHDVWWAPVNTPAEVLADPQAIAAGAFVDVPEGEGAPAHRAVATPDHVPRPRRRRRWVPVPGLGEHTDEVLRGGRLRARRPRPLPRRRRHRLTPPTARSGRQSSSREHVVHLEAEAAQLVAVQQRERRQLGLARLGQLGAAGGDRRSGRRWPSTSPAAAARCTSSTAEWCLSCSTSATSPMVGALVAGPALDRQQQLVLGRA